MAIVERAVGIAIIVRIPCDVPCGLEQVMAEDARSDSRSLTALRGEFPNVETPFVPAVAVPEYRTM
jgi:hypothetical protein